MKTKSQELFKKAKRYIPGGVNSPVRAGKAVGIDPPFIARAQGCTLWDADGNPYIDYVSSWGPMILGHAHPDVINALTNAIQRGTSYGAPTELEVEMAELIVTMVPSIDRVRMVNSGTEATMSAIRLARGITGRNKIIKFDGCYHGHGDSLLVEAGSGVATFGIPGSPGVPEDLARQTISLPFNNLAAVEETFQRFGDDIAALIVEPVPGNMGVVVPQPNFLRGLRDLTRSYRSILIFDEVITGFRLSRGGAQEYFNITPDLTCLGKIIGGGLPVGAFGGKRDLMARLAPDGDVYQAGTLSGNPLAMAAGLATLRILNQPDVYSTLEQRSNMFFSGLKSAAQEAGIPVMINRVESMGSLFFCDSPVTDFAGAKKSDAGMFKRYYTSMLEQGVYLAPSPFEATFLSLAHTEEVIGKTLDFAAKAFRSHL
ncbi:MAG: glutamate-1-semialdehyde-2,1-aminomutase [Deltaproteobacteria bacterium]|nr:MAG: glutamate-1-semialdehyde-2,1-aminomutase [Desulfobacteraceae bacterium 4484_190.3]RLB15897.1 MAG: glutamate-1-semialdehyde-2,1-aminomutase [Deltaproteobacteria bacterium]